MWQSRTAGVLARGVAGEIPEIRQRNSTCLGTRDGVLFHAWKEGIANPAPLPVRRGRVPIEQDRLGLFRSGLQAQGQVNTLQVFGQRAIDRAPFWPRTPRSATLRSATR